MPIPASGGAHFKFGSRKVIRLAYHGCTNRPFYHIVVMEKSKRRQEQCIEQLGTFDPMANAHGEKLLALNIERLTYWIGRKIPITEGNRRLFGLAGLLPIHPKSYMEAWNAREKTRELREERLRKEAENIIKEQT